MRYFDKAIRILLDKSRRRRLWEESVFVEVLAEKENIRLPMSIVSDSEDEPLEKVEKPDIANQVVSHAAVFEKAATMSWWKPNAKKDETDKVGSKNDKSTGLVLQDEVYLTEQTPVDNPTDKS